MGQGQKNKGETVVETTIINSFGAKLEAPAFLAPLWPHDLPLHKWPTFCGAGDGMGDTCVPDSWYLGTVYVAPACFVHDICWSICDNSEESFDWSNDMFKRNLKALVNAQLCWPFSWVAYNRCYGYFAAVSTFGRLVFDHEHIPAQDPFDNSTVRDRLHRLARVAHGIPGYKDGEVIS